MSDAELLRILAALRRAIQDNQKWTALSLVADAERIARAQ